MNETQQLWLVVTMLAAAIGVLVVRIRIMNQQLHNQTQRFIDTRNLLSRHLNDCKQRQTRVHRCRLCKGVMHRVPEQRGTYECEDCGNQEAPRDRTRP